MSRMLVFLYLYTNPAIYMVIVSSSIIWSAIKGEPGQTTIYNHSYKRPDKQPDAYVLVKLIIQVCREDLNIRVLNYGETWTGMTGFNKSCCW